MPPAQGAPDPTNFPALVRATAVHGGGKIELQPRETEMTPCLHRHGGAGGWSAREWRERRRGGDGDGGGVSVVEEMTENGVVSIQTSWDWRVEAWKGKRRKRKRRRRRRRWSWRKRAMGMTPGLFRHDGF